MQTGSLPNPNQMLLYQVPYDPFPMGFRGLNFERPAFQQMLHDAESGLFNHVITKDLSRLGRDYLQTGYYTEVYFPQNHIRYIAVYDGIDTQIDSNEIAPFKNILNEMLSLRRIAVQQHEQIVLGIYRHLRARRVKAHK